MLSGRRCFRLIYAIVCLTPVCTWADEVTTRNGDRLTGEILTMEDNVLSLHTEYGEMKIDWGKVVHVTSDKPMKVRVAGEKKGFISDFFIGGHEFRHVTELRQNGPIPISGTSVMTARSPSEEIIRPATPTPRR